MCETTYGQLPRWDWLRCRGGGRANRIGCDKRLSVIVCNIDQVIDLSVLYYGGCQVYECSHIHTLCGTCLALLNLIPSLKEAHPHQAAHHTLSPEGNHLTVVQ